MKLFERTLNASLAVAAVVMAAALVHRELVPRAAASSLNAIEFRSDWRDLLKVSRLASEPADAVQIIEFADLECPYCRLFHEKFANLAQRYPGRVSLHFIHYPLTNHKFAMSAARAAECAHGQNRFRQFVDAVYEKQDSLGMIPWGLLGQAVGIPDSSAFAQCVASSQEIDVIAKGRSAGEAIALKATPTLLVNGWRYNGVPTDSTLLETVERLLSGKKPRGAK